MNDLMLRFDSEQAMLDVLSQAGMTYTNEEGIVIPMTGSHQYALDIIGFIPLYPEELSGYCANLRVIDTEMNCSAFEQYIVFPTKPYRVWA